MEHNAALETPSTQGITPKYIRIIKDSLTRSHLWIALFNKPIKMIVDRDVKQGSIYSLEAFTFTLEIVLRSMRMIERSPMDSGVLQSLLSAEDLVLITENLQMLQNLWNELNGSGKQIRLEIHSGKMELMKNVYCHSFNMKLQKTKISGLLRVYVYMGQAIQMDNDLDTKLSR